MLANGTSCTISNAFSFTVFLKGKSFLVTFHYMPSLSVSATLGIDAINKIGLCIESDGQWYFREDSNNKYEFSEIPNLKGEYAFTQNVCGIHIPDPEERKILDKIVQDGVNNLETSSGRTNKAVHKIDVGEAKPIKQKAYTYSP